LVDLGTFLHELRQPLTALGLHIDARAHFGGTSSKELQQLRLKVYKMEAFLYETSRARRNARRQQADDQFEQPGDARNFVELSRQLLGHLSGMRALIDRARTKEGEGVKPLEAEVSNMTAIVAALRSLSDSEVDALTLDGAGVEQIALTVLERAELGRSLLSMKVDGDLELSADPTLLGLVLRNLVGNARRYGNGAEKLRIEQEGPWVHFIVEDSGPGFSKADLPTNVFKARTQGTSKVQKDAQRAGQGLGLFIVRRIAEAHGGQAGAENKDDGSGARVWISLPTTPRR
jgi:signal transduction histidine kinase